MPGSTRQQLLDAAVELFIEGDGITTGRLTQRAGVVQSAFYNHFASVAECRSTALQEVERRVAAAAALAFATLQGTGPLPDEDVEPIVATVFRRAVEYPPVYRLIVHRRLDDDLGAVIDGALDAIRSALEQILRRGSPHGDLGSDEQIQAMAHTIISIFMSGLEQVLGGASPEQVAMTCAAFITAGRRSLAS